MEDQDFPLVGVFEGFLGVRSDEIYRVPVSGSDVYGVLVSDSDV